MTKILLENYIEKGEFIDKRSMPENIAMVEDKIVIINLSDYELIKNAIIGAMSALPQNTNAINHLNEILRLYFKDGSRFYLEFSVK